MTISPPLQVLSVCMTLPTEVRPQQGIFVYRRLQAMAQHLPVRALRPQPWFPAIRGGALDPPIRDASFPIDCRRMAYLPGVAKWLDGRWMKRCVDRWLDELQPDPEHTVLDAHFGYPEGVACHLAAKQRGMRYFITLRGVEEDWLRQPRVRWQMVEALNQAAGVIAVSESLRRAVIAAGVDGRRIRVIPNGCDTSTFYPGDRRDARRRLGLASDRQLIVSVTNLKPVKGHDRIIRALARLKEQTDFQWICIGAVEQNAFARHLHQLADHHALADHIRFTGPLPSSTVADYLRAADVFVLASRREGCCNATREAMSCGTPVVVTAVGDHPQLAERYVGIELVDAEDAEAFSDEILAAFQRGAPATIYGKPQFESQSWTQVAAECVKFIRESCNRT